MAPAPALKASTQSPLVKSAAAKKSARSTAAAAITPAGPQGFDQQVRFDAGGVWPPEVKALLRDEPSLAVTPRGRLKIDPIGPHQLLGRHEAALRGKEWASRDQFTSSALTNREHPPAAVAALVDLGSTA